jgi:hypothetical protein
MLIATCVFRVLLCDRAGLSGLLCGTLAQQNLRASAVIHFTDCVTICRFRAKAKGLF